ncbi:MAG: hypothetical protein F9K22_02450 [Bacteroidetes bacterium]|nr:MAG: hypothetical protein F9K22_02450 [Bacteroidota bacterium]
MKKLLLLVGLTLPAVAGEGSVYSRFGVGDIAVFTNGRAVGMGGAGIALMSESNMQFANPAASSLVNRTLFNAGYQYRFFTSEDAGGTSMVGTGTVNEFGLAFPLYSPYRMVLTAGFVPVSSVGYEQRVDQPAYGVTQVFEGRGGISSGQLGLSYSRSGDLYLGLTGHYLFGSIYRDHSLRFASSDLFSGSYNQTLSMSGFALTAGAVVAGVDKLFGLSDTRNVNLGITVFSGSTLELDDETLRNFSSNQDTLLSAGQELTLPFGFTVGAAMTRNRVVYAADLQFQNWSSFTAAGVHPSELRNSLRVSAGAEYLGSGDFGSDFWERVSVRLGGYYRMTNLSVNGEGIDEVFGTAGIGLPFSFESRLNIGIEAGVRGAVTSTLIRDTIMRFTVSLTASELMFIPPVID